MSAVSVWTKKLEQAEAAIAEPIVINGQVSDHTRKHTQLWLSRSDLKALRALLKQATK